MLKRIYLTIFIGSIILSPFMAWGQERDTVSIQNSQMYLGDDNTLHIVGEIENKLQAPLRNVKIHAELYDKDNHLIDTVTTRTPIKIIMPDMKTPFDIMILENNRIGKEINSYHLDLDYELSNPKSQVIDIMSSELSRDSLDNLFISGIVTNRGQTTANTISIVATLYDKDGNVVTVSQDLIGPDYLRPDEETFFAIAIPDKSQTDKIVDYLLVAESEEYAAVSEFSISSAIVLLGSVGGFLFITKYYPNRFISKLVYASDPR